MRNDIAWLECQYGTCLYRVRARSMEPHVHRLWICQWSQILYRCMYILWERYYMYTLDEMWKTSKDFGNKRIWMSRWVVASLVGTKHKYRGWIGHACAWNTVQSVLTCGDILRRWRLLRCMGYHQSIEHRCARYGIFAIAKVEGERHFAFDCWP